MKKITLLLFTFFFTSLGFSQLPLEGFEGATFPPTNWAVFDIGVGTVNWSTNVNSCQGTLAAYMNRQNVGAGNAIAEYLATPSVPVPTNGELRFFSRTFTAGNSGTIYEVRLSPVTSTQNDPASYTTLLASYTEDQLSAVFNVCDEHVIDLSAYAGQNVYISFVMKYTQPAAALSGDRWLLDNVQVIEKCLDPTAQGAAPLATTANLTWTSTAANFEIENILGTGAPTGVATGSSSTNSFTQTGLAPNTNYCYYVRAVCANSSSEWVGPFCYTTSTLPPVCGGNFTDPGGSTGNYTNNLDVTTTICPDNTTDLVTVTFTSFATEACCDDLIVYAGTGTGGTVLGTFAGNAIPPEITSTAPGQCLTFVFTSDGSVTAAGWIANVTCAPAPTCPKPTALATSAVTSTNATLAWTNNSTATTFHVLALPCGSPAPTAGSTGWVSTTNNPYTFTTLNPDTCYTFYVRAECSGTDISDWSVGLNATTQVIPPACGGIFTDPQGATTNYINGITATNGGTTTICPTNSTDLVTVTFTSFATENCCDHLSVYDGSDSNAPFLGMFQGTVSPGEVTSSVPGGCLTFVFTSDGSVTAAGWTANVTCAPAPTCPKPTALSTSVVTSTNATLAWTNNSTATTFHVLAVPCGSPAPDASTTGWISTTNNPYTFTTLNPDTCYTFYVRAECSSTDISNWSLGVNATTQIAPPVCGGIFTDPAGSTVNYANNTNSTVTICPAPGEQVTVIFTSFQTENNFDGLYVYDGDSTTAPSVQIPSANGPGFGQLTTPGAFWGNLNANLPGPFTASGPTGCLTFQFISDGSVNNPGWVANVLCLPPPTCTEPTSLAVANITTTSALLSWTQPLNPDNSTATTWEVFVVPAGSPAPIGNQAGAITTTTNPFLVTGLLAGTNYTYYVRAVCSSTDQSLWSSGFNFSTLIINDNCDGAIFAPVNSNAYCNLTIDGTISGATPSNVPLAPCVGTADDDSWFQFIATNTYLNISLQSITGSTNNLNHAVYSGNCNNLTLLYCSDPNSSTANGLVVGQTYYIRVYSNEATPQTVDFTLCISTPSTCETSSTVCNTNYANTTGVTSLGTVGCLFTSPNPTFFTIQIIGNGPINYLLTQSTTQGGAPNLDVDYAAWGPFSSQAAVCAAMGNPPTNPLTGLTTGCSYSAAPTENFNIPGAQAGQFYVILITNFSNQQGFISLTQTNAGQPGAGVTFCCSDPDFTYPSFSFCKDGGINPVVTLGSNSEAGVFSSNPSTGLVFVSTATGEIDLAASAPGNYIITNTLAATVTCEERTFTYTIQITEPQTATLSYAETVFCNTDTDVEPAILTGATTGNYSSTPSGLFINANTGEINPSLSNPGVYDVIYTIAAAGGCPIFMTQPVQIEIIATPNIPQIQDVNICDSYTLPTLTVGNYFTGVGGTGTQLNPGDSLTTSQTIYVYAQTNTTPNCTDEESFDVTITPTPQVDILPSISICSSYTLPTLIVGNYFTGAGGTGTQLNAGDSITSTQTIYIYAQSGTTPNCFSESNFTVTIGNLVVTAPASVTSCDTYTLSALALGNYFTGAGGTGTQLSAGDAITSTQTIYVYAVDGTCTAEDQFTVTIVPTPQADTLPNVSQCGNYLLPTLTVGNYFTGTGGAGTQLNAGDSITTTQTIYIYAQSGTTPNCFTETSFTVTIGTLVVTAPASVTLCDTYTLPALALGNYFTGSGGTGTQLNAGDSITSTQTIYVYAVDGTCTAEDQFTVTIVPTPQADMLPNVSTCGSYILPTLTVGNYFTGTGGTGTQLNAGDSITSSQTIYIYAQSGTTPNCFTETSFAVTITTLVVTAPASGSYCGSYALPALAIGNYFTGTGGTGTQLNAGDIITTTQTIYVYAVDGTCTDEDSFTVTINSIVADNLADVFACDSYTLPALSSGNDYYTGTNGTGTLISSGTVLTSTQVLYIFAQTGTTPNCTDEQDIVITINNTPVPDAPANVVACDNYTLPALTVGNYYTQTNGGGTQLLAGSVINSNTTLYVYAQSGTSPNCTAENSFTITINSATAQILQDVSRCDSYILPVLNANNNYYTGTGGSGTQLLAGATITSSQTIYIYTQSGTTPNCTDESSFIVTITPSPIVQPINAVTACDSYTLPSLTVGNYYTGPGGTGTQLIVGDTITSSQTIYVYAQSGTTPNCTDEESFVITINPTPIFTIEGDCIGPVFTLFIASGNLPANPSYQWYNDSTPMGTGATQAITAPGNYSCTISSANTCPSTPTYTAIESNCIVPKGISPNGDGKNDSFDLSGFNVSQLNIYNRYGTVVYSKAQYVDEWFGQADNGNELPDGTYYYVIERENAEAKTGWVYINRNAN